MSGAYIGMYSALLRPQSGSGGPLLSSAVIASGGTTIAFTFTVSVSVGGGGSAGWTISMSGGAATLSYSSGSGSSTLVYTISRTVNSGETGTVAYTQPGNGIEATTGGADVASIGSASVTNGSSQGSSNPISAARRVDWEIYAGVEGGIPNRTTVHSTVSAYTGTAATINTAITNASNAGGNNVVMLGIGTFLLSTTIQFKSNVTLRGTLNADGTIGTKLVFTGVGGSGFFFGSGKIAVIFQGNFDSSGYSGSAGTPQQGGIPAGNRKTWTGCGGVAGSFPKGATVLNLGSAPTGSPNLQVNDMLLVWQTNEASGTVPRDGFYVTDKTDHSGTTATGISWQGSNASPQNLQSRHKVTAISGSDVTIWPPLPHDGYKSGNTPMVGWQGGDIRMAGLENVWVDVNTSGPTDQWSSIQGWQASNCWVKGCIVEPKTAASGNGLATQMVVQWFESRNCEALSNWIHKGAGGGQGSTTTYGIVPVNASWCLTHNNIFYQTESPMLIHASAVGNVYGYNYEIWNGSHEGGMQCHETGVIMNLFEGNIAKKFFGDLFHGPSLFMTHLRNYTFASEIGFDLQAGHRYHNCLGNVIAAPNGYTTKCTDGDQTAPFLQPDPNLRARDSGYAFRLGMPSQGDTNDPWWNGGDNMGVAFDPQVAATLLRWGNYTAFDGLTRYDSSEVPSSEAFYPNAVPSNHTIPTSYYLTARPIWFTHNGTTVAWPPIGGDDVTGGTSQGGRVHKLPAQREYERATVPANFKPGLYGV